MAKEGSREIILNKIRQALRNPVPLPFPESEGKQMLFQHAPDDLISAFRDEFSRLQGNFVFCETKQELTTAVTNIIAEKKWNKVYYKEDWINGVINRPSFMDLAECDVSITGCECLVARTGTIVMSSAEQSGRTTSVYAPIHICIASLSSLVYDLGDAFKLMESKYGLNLPSLVTFASGPSRTADIEKTLVTGVHGPKEVYCFLCGFYCSLKILL